jgi:type I restriction enzyme S subunit
MQAGDVLFNLVGASIGRGCVLPDVESEANTNQAVAVVRVNREKVLPEYVLGYMLSPSGLKSILGTSVNTARANLTLEGIRGTRVPVEPLKVQQERVRKIHAVEKLAHRVSQSRGDLIAVKSSFLNQVFTQ